MRLSWLAVAALAVTQTPVLSQSAAPEPAVGDTVRVDVITTDAHGRFVDNLTAADFSLREDGFEQTLDDVRLIKVRGTSGQSETVQPVRLTSAAEEDRKSVV